jgi:hypothetical protein
VQWLKVKALSSSPSTTHTHTHTHTQRWEKYTFSRNLCLYPNNMQDSGKCLNLAPFCFFSSCCSHCWSYKYGYSNEGSKLERGYMTHKGRINWGE